MPRSAFSRETLICGHARSAPLTVSERWLANGFFSWYMFGKLIGSFQTTLGHKLSQDSMMFLRRRGVVSRLIRGPLIVYPLDILHSLSDGAHIWHARVSWHGQQCCRSVFSVLSDENRRWRTVKGADLRGPRSRVSLETDRRSAGIPQKLACDP